MLESSTVEFAQQQEPSQETSTPTLSHGTGFRLARHHTLHPCSWRGQWEKGSSDNVRSALFLQNILPGFSAVSCQAAASCCPGHASQGQGLGTSDGTPCNCSIPGAAHQLLPHPDRIQAKLSKMFNPSLVSGEGGFSSKARHPPSPNSS